MLKGHDDNSAHAARIVIAEALIKHIHRKF